MRTWPAYVGVLLLLSGDPVLAQERTLVRDTCDACSLELREIARLSDESTGLAFGDAVIVAAAHGRLFVVSQIDPAVVGVYTPEGLYLGSFGGSGGGPGEFRFVGNILPARADSIYVVDRLAARLSTHDPNLDHARAHPSPVMVFEGVSFVDGSYVLAGRVATGDQFPFTFHRYSPSGTHVQSFNGVADPTTRDDFQWRRRIAVASDTSFWAMRDNSYELTEWSWTGQIQQVLIGDAPWMKRGASQGYNPLYEVPPGGIRSIALEDELIWVTGHRADPEWNPPNRGARPENAQTDFEEDEVFDTLIEVIDPSTSRVLTSYVSGEYLWHVLGSKLLYKLRMAPDGSPMIHVYEPVLHRN